MNKIELEIYKSNTLGRILERLMTSSAHPRGKVFVLRNGLRNDPYNFNLKPPLAQRPHISRIVFVGFNFLVKFGRINLKTWIENLQHQIRISQRLFLKVSSICVVLFWISTWIKFQHVGLNTFFKIVLQDWYIFCCSAIYNWFKSHWFDN